MILLANLGGLESGSLSLIPLSYAGSWNSTKRLYGDIARKILIDGVIDRAYLKERQLKIESYGQNSRAARS